MQDVIPGEAKESLWFNENAYKSIALQNVFKTLTRKKKIKEPWKLHLKIFKTERKTKETKQRNGSFASWLLVGDLTGDQETGEGGLRLVFLLPWLLPDHVAVGWHVPPLEDSLLLVSFTPLCSYRRFCNHSPLPSGLRALDCRWPRYCISPSKFPHFCQQSPF